MTDEVDPTGVLDKPSGSMDITPPMFTIAAMPAFKMPTFGSLTAKRKSASSAVATAFMENAEIASLAEVVAEEKSSSTDVKSDASNVTSTLESSDVDKKVTGQSVSSSSRCVAFSPAEQLRESQAVIAYREPLWSGPTDQMYYFEVIKNGLVTDRIDLTAKSYHVFGRLPSCDHPMDHPSLSRHHAVIQHRAVAGEGVSGEVGWYLYDLDSTHGTWLNKNRVTPRTYCRLRVGHVVKFGGSTRLHVLQGPDSDQAPESDLSVSELRQQRDRQTQEALLLRRVEQMEAEQTALRRQKSDDGCSWGITECDTTEEDDGVNPFATLEPLQEQLYIDDPKKALKGFYEREGFDLPEYEFLDEGKGQHKCRVELPIETPTGEPMYAEVAFTGKKKEAVVACALEACRMLDRQGLLRKATHEGRGKKRKNWEDADFYDSDEDVFLDRTGDVEKKRRQRMLRTGMDAKSTETYESLSSKLVEVQKELKSIDDRLTQDKTEKEALQDDGVDALDAFMMSIKSGGMDSRTRTQLKHRQVELRQQQLKLERLVHIAKPALPTVAGSSNTTTTVKTPCLPMFGKMRSAGVKSARTTLPSILAVTTSTEFKVEEDEDDDVKTSSCADVTVTSRVDERTNVTSSNHSDVKVDNCDNLTVGNHGDMTLVNNGDSTVAAKCDVFVDNSEKQTVSHSLTVHQPAPPVNTSVDTSVPVGCTDVTSQISGERDKRESGAQRRKRDKLAKTVESCTTYTDDPDYAVWVPPQDQSGDGKTRLNDKYGY